MSAATTSTLFIATTKETTKEVPRPEAAAPLLWWRPKAATFVVAMNRVDVVDLVVDLVDVDLDVDLVDVDLDVDLVDVDLVDLGQRRFSFLLMLPCGRPRS